MKKIFIEKLNYKSFIKNNKLIVALTFGQIFFYLHLTLGFLLIGFLSFKYDFNKAVLSSAWIIVLGLIIYINYSLKVKIKKD